jgi:hypothetical protein
MRIYWTVSSGNLVDSDSSGLMQGVPDPGYRSLQCIMWKLAGIRSGGARCNTIGAVRVFEKTPSRQLGE